MDSVNIYYGADSDFDKIIRQLDSYNTIGDLLNHIAKKEITLSGFNKEQEEELLTIENLVVFTDDYGSIREWALLGFSNNVLEHPKIIVNNVYFNNPPLKIYHDVKKTYSNCIYEKSTDYPVIDLDTIKRIATDFEKTIIGQPCVVGQLLPGIYSLKNPTRKRPVSLLFLGESGIGKTETAKFISNCLGGEMVRVQFSMQQTGEAYKFIFGAEHSENSLARELIRRETNVILLDEFDKVQPSFYNAFYEMFDEGLFVDSNYSVNVESCIIICTTNYLTESEAEKNLGTPIYSRFSKVIEFLPIKCSDKIIIAEKNYNSIISQLTDDDLELVKENDILNFYKHEISQGAYKNMRMLKNDIEDAINFEILKRRGIL